jgi:hypothetical protein
LPGAIRAGIVGYYLTAWRNVSRILTPYRPVFVKYGRKIRAVPRRAFFCGRDGRHPEGIRGLGIF